MKFYESEEIRYWVKKARFHKNMRRIFGRYQHWRFLETLGILEHRLMHDYDEQGDLIRVEGPYEP